MIYLLSCTKCRQQYVGETIQTLNERVRKHISDINCEREHRVAEHFNSAGHSADNVRVMGLSTASRDKRVRRAQESALVWFLGTLSPAGLNTHYA